MQTLCDPFALIKERLKPGATCYYMPNGGNLGDCLISSATIQCFDSYQISWKYIRGHRKLVRPCDLLVYGGGGSLVTFYQGGIECLHSLIACGGEVIVLPQSINGHSDFWMLPAEITAFCRDHRSLQYLSGFDNVTTLFYHDLATLLDLSQEPFSTVVQLHRSLLSSRGPSSLYVFRNDIERLIDFQHSFTDLASIAFPSMNSTDIIHSNSCILLASLAGHSKVHTDRLHVAIGASLLGISVDLYDTVHRKNSSVYEATLRYLYPHLRLCTTDSFDKV